MRFVFTVWIRNPSMPSDDEDYEWPACFVIEAASAASAKSWGDHLSARYAASRDDAVVLSSEVEPVDTSTLPGLDRLPEIADGHEASNAEIGW